MIKANFWQDRFAPQSYRRTWLFIVLSNVLELAIPILCAALINSAIPNENGTMAAILLISAALSGFFLSYLKRKLTNILGQESVDYQKKVRIQIVDKYFSESFPEASRTEFAHFSTAIIQDLNSLCELVFDKIPNSLASALFCISSLAVLLYVDTKITSVMVAFIVIVCVLIVRLKRTLIKRTSKTAECREQLNLKIQELLQARSTIKLYSLTDICMAQLKAAGNKYIEYFLRSNILSPSVQSSIEISTMLSYVLVFSVYSHSELSAGTVFLYFSYLGQIWKHFSSMMDIFNYMASAEVYAKRVEEVCKEDNDARISHGDKLLHHITSIQFKDMSFEHEKGHRLFDKLDLEISGCGLYALVGASGSGKSTLFDLLLGLQDLADGRILLNSTEIHEINLKSLHQQIGFVPQDKFFFNRSIYDNISLNRGISKEDVQNYINELNVARYFAHMQNGLDTVIMDLGKSLSTSQKAIISLLRASCMRPSVILLDEIMANISNECKSDINAALHCIARQCIVILIVHDLDALYDVGDYHVIRIG